MRGRRLTATVSCLPDRLGTWSTSSREVLGFMRGSCGEF